ncbi:aminotransferase class V-fold PLP-dependent enzyme [Candidatus Poribacteria bacterium]|nr:aminotransferase class V-fold PLP-dependent enzyme [Candidatus Poribacteria bacterium]
MAQPIYMDSHATTPLDPRVLEAMMPYLTDHFGNAASSTHLFGEHAKDGVDAARHQVADLIGCSDEEIIFTSGATESDNLAVKGVAYQYKNRGNHIVTSTVEHHAVLDSCKALEESGFDITYLPVDKYGMVHPQQVEDAITDRTMLISLIYVNGEVGTINPITEVGEIAEKYGILFHSDATQGIGKIESNVDKLKVDLMSFTAHKMYGPKGIGALYARKKAPPIQLYPLLHGGGQENNIRSGTLNVPGIVGFGAACELCKREMTEEANQITELREQLYHGLSKRIDLIHLNGHPTKRVPGNLNLSFEFVESQSILSGLKEIALSSGSACNSDSVEPSYVLRAMGVKDELALGAIRFGLGRHNTGAEVDTVVECVAAQLARLRELSPLYEMVQSGNHEAVIPENGEV